MNKTKRSLTLKILNSGHSAMNIFSSLSLLLQQPQEDIQRIINANKWDRKLILNSFNMFTNSYKEPIEYLKIYGSG